jgi:amino acid transporter
MSLKVAGTRGVFTRAASGLVRQVGTRDVFFFGFQTIALSYIVFTILAWGAYPGASMELAALIATVGGIAIGSVYAMVAAVYPRSGAEYVFLSRSLHPAVGFALSFSFAFWQMFYVGINGTLFCVYAISPTLAGIGVLAHNQGLIDAGTWFATGWGLFLGASAAVLLMGYLLYRGAGGYFRWQRVGSYVVFVSLAITILVLLLAATGVLSFKANFNQLAGANAYQSVIDAGVKAGAAPQAPFALGQTLLFVLWPAFSLWFAITAISFSGEVKNVRRGQLLGIGGSVLATGILFIVMMALYRNAFGADFMLSAAAKGTPLHAPALVPFFTAVAGGSALLAIVMSLWVLTNALFVTGTAALYPSRTVVAWAIDGMVPERLADVNERYRSPHWAILLTVIVAEITIALFAFTTLLGVVSGFLGLALNFLVVCGWAIVFPFVRRGIFDSSPIAWRVAGIPVLTLVGAFATINIIPILYRLTVDTTFSLNLAFVIWGAVIVLAIGFAYYFAWRLYLRRRGIDIARRYAEIPIE